MDRTHRQCRSPRPGIASSARRSRVPAGNGKIRPREGDTQVLQQPFSWRYEKSLHQCLYGGKQPARADIIVFMIPILMYHQIGQPAPQGSPYSSLVVHPADFRRQLTWLRRVGDRGLSMRDLMPYVNGQRHGKVVGITFDDGYRNVYQNALPVLAEQGFTATNYFVARQLGGGNVWDREKGIAHSDLMSPDEMRA